MQISKKSSIKFVILLGLVSLFADVTYEGARSITGPFLATLGASAAAVGVVAGLGELIGYSLRLVSGYIADKTKRYWALTIAGYALNLFAIPILALAGNWQIACVLMVSERIGKAIRTPARDAILSHATKQMGHGFGFGLHEAMDQIGALLGPIIVAIVLYLKGGYRTGFIVLLVPAICAIAVLLAARFLYPRPEQMEANAPKLEAKGLAPNFWFYLAAVGLVAAGFADFPLIAYHFKKVSIAPDNWIPIFYALAMGVDAISALIFGRLFDKRGVPILVIAVMFSALFAPFVFFGNFLFCLAGMVLWGIGMGAQESIMRAAVASMVSSEKRATAYGIFNTGFGVFWFLGSALMGILYDISLFWLIVFSVAMQVASIPMFVLVGKKSRLVKGEE